MYEITAQEYANVYRSHARILEYILKDPSLTQKRIESLKDTWLGIADMIEKELEADGTEA